jgi:hypothetical protein
MMNDKRRAARKSGADLGKPKSASVHDPQAARVDELASVAREYLERGNVIDALQTVWQALAQRETPDAKAIFIGCFRQLRFSADAPEMRGVVARAVSESWGRIDEFSTAATDRSTPRQSPQPSRASPKPGQAC